MRVRRADEQGVVAVWMAMMLVVLLGVTAFAIDVSSWHFEQSKEQRAADAASLAGAIDYPGDATSANAAALGIAQNNGYDVGSLSAFDAGGKCKLGAGQTMRICAGPGALPYQYKVKVVHRVTNLFGGIFGIGKSNVSASATAEYLKPLSMGSPSNQFGNDPDSTSWPINPNNPPQTYPNFWANIEGGGTAKQQGDAYAANWCDGPPLVTDGCAATGNGQNLDYAQGKGYYYTVDFTGAGTVNLQAFDPAFVHVAQFCNDSKLTGAAALANVPGYPEGASSAAGRADRLTRYAVVGDSSKPTDPGWQYCTGDNIFPNSAGQDVPPATTYTVLKATVPGVPSSAVPVAGCNPITYPGFYGDTTAALSSGFTTSAGMLSTYFRQWVTLCQVTGNPGDEYFIEVSTDNGGGSNHFALRGETPGDSPGPVNIAGNTYMGMYANVGTNTLTKFYVVRIPTASKGHTLVLNFYDIGDADSVGSLQVIPPADSTGTGISGGLFTGNSCLWTGNSSTGALGFAANTPKAPWGTLTPITNCEITGVNGGGTWNAQWSTVQIPIPANYTCNDSDPKGCWVTINYLFNGPVHDVTSWNAFLLGDPVRLTQ